MSPLVSVVIPAFESSDTICGAVESALDQTVVPHEIIVVDDASPDGEQLAKKLEPWIERGKVSLLRLEENRGPAAARNRGIAASSGELISLLDADDRYERERLEAAVEVFERHPETAVTCSDAFITRDEEVLPGLKNDRFQPIDPIISMDRLIEYNIVNTLSVTMRRDVFDEFGPFDEDPALVAVEDYDLWLKIADTRVIRYIDRPLCRYRISGESLSSSTEGMSARVKIVLARLEKTLPGFRSRYRAALRRRREHTHFDLAYDHYTRGDRFGACRHAWQAICTAPLSLRYYALFLKAIFLFPR